MSCFLAFLSFQKASDKTSKLRKWPPCILWSGVLEWSYGEYWSGVAKILITPAESVYLIFSNIWTCHF